MNMKNAFFEIVKCLEKLMKKEPSQIYSYFSRFKSFIHVITKWLSIEM